MWHQGDDVIVLVVHVDDGLMASNSASVVEEFIAELRTHLRKVKLFDEPKKYLGMDIVYCADGRYYLHQEQKIDEWFGQEYTKPTSTPMSNTTNLRKEVKNPENKSLLPDTGRFRYLADRTRPDILVSVGEVSTGGDKEPSDEHVRVSRRIKNYLTTTKDLGLYFGGDDPVKLFAYVDAAYITEGNARSRLGGCLFAGTNSGAIDCFSRNDTTQSTSSTLSHSSTEAEIKALDEIVRMIEYWIQVFQFLLVEIADPVKIYIDNQSAIELCRVLKTTHAVRHINMRIKYIYECINAGMVALYFVPGEYNVADVLTKPLPVTSFERHISILMRGHGGDVETMLHSHAVHCSHYMK